MGPRRDRIVVAGMTAQCGAGQTTVTGMVVDRDPPTGPRTADRGLR
jgi:hypothetical protein